MAIWTRLRCLLAFAEVQDKGLAEWIAKKSAFPNSMVDRIYTVTRKSQIIETLATKTMAYKMLGPLLAKTILYNG